MGQLQEHVAQLQEQLAQAQEQMAADSRAGPALSVEVPGATPQDAMEAKVRRTIYAHVYVTTANTINVEMCLLLHVFST